MIPAMDYPFDEERANIDRSTYVRVVADEQRRILLEQLDGRQTPLDVEQLAAEAAALEAEGEPPEEAVDRAAVSLHHCHLPLLSDVGLLDYDPESNRITDHRVDQYLPLS